MNKAAKIITWVLIILALVGAIGAIAYFTGGFTSEFKTFYVTANGKDVMTSATGYEMTINDPMTVEVKYSLADENTSGYTVKVVPNQISGKDFDFTLDGEVYSFQAEKDLTKGFNIEYSDTSFVIKPKGSLNEIMGAIYPDYTVGDMTENGYENMFLLVVSSYNGEQSVTIAFTVPDDIAGVTIDPPKIEF